MPHPEALLISAVLRTGSAATLSNAGVSSLCFTVHKAEMQWIEQFIGKHRRVPDKTAFKNRWPECPLYRTDDVEHWTEEVAKEHSRTCLVNLLDRSIDLVGEEDIDRAVKQLQAGLLDLQAQRKMGGRDVFADWQDTFDDVERRVKKVMATGQSGIPTGFPSLDAVTGGFQDGWLAIVAGRLGMGKTWTAVRMACTAAFAGHSVCYFSLEQSRQQIALRVHTFASGKYGRDVFQSLDLMRGHGFNLRNYRKFLESMVGQVKGKMWVDDSSRGAVTPLSIAATIEERKPDIVFIDYLTLLSTGKKDWQEVASLSGQLQQIAQRARVPIIALSQVNRLGIGKEPPGAEHLSQADAIGHDADLVLTMMQKSKRVMKMRLAKNRHGPQDVMWFCRFSPNTGQFDEISGDEAADIIEKDAEVP